MIRTLAWLPVLAAALSAAPDLSEERSRQLTSKLGADGLAGRLAEALRTDWGRKAFNERLELLQAIPLHGARHGAHELWEQHYFAADEAGRLVLRPERRAEFERLKNRRAASLARFEKYSKRLDELGERIVEENDLDKAAKAGWKERPWRIGLYNGYMYGGLPDSDHDLDQAIDARLQLWLLPRADRKLRVAQPGEDAVRWLVGEVYGLMDEVKKYEAAFLKLMAKAEPALAKAASADEVVLITCARLAMEIKADGGEALTKLVALDPKEVVQEAQAAIRAVAQIKPRLDAMAAALAEDETSSNDLKTFLSDARARVLLGLRLAPTDAAVTAKLDWFFSHILPGAWCDAQGDKLIFKRGWFKGGGGDSVATFRAHTYDSWGGIQLQGMQAHFLSTAERCADPQIGELIRDLDMLSLLRQDEARFGEHRSAAIRHEAVDLFVKLYLAEKDGKLVVQAGREASIESLLARAESLKPKN